MRHTRKLTSQRTGPLKSSAVRGFRAGSEKAWSIPVVFSIEETQEKWGAPATIFPVNSLRGGLLVYGKPDHQNCLSFTGPALSAVPTQPSIFTKKMASISTTDPAVGKKNPRAAVSTK